MKVKHITAKLVMASVVVIGLVLITLNAGGGSLEPNAPPGPTMHSLEDIYQAVSSSSFGSQPPPKPLAFDCFMKIVCEEFPDGILGESTDSKHQNWIDILSYSHKVKPMVTGESFFDVFTVVKTLDKASPKLALFCCRGDNLKEVTLELCDPNRSSYNIMRYKLSNVLVSGVQIRESPLNSIMIRESPTAASLIRESPYDCLPLEEVSFNFAKIEWTYTTADGNTVRTDWDAYGKTGF
jgi:type VI secretion system secreted protein Hcp